MNMEQKHPSTINKKYEYLFTVFTPTYNRAHTLFRVYKSLKTQTCQNFEWLIIDDGSSDNTCELVHVWQNENLFPIRYIYQENAGKHVVFNRAVKEAKGELFLTFDSDDACLCNTLERFKYHWNQIPEKQKQTFSAITCLCQDEQGKVIGDYFPLAGTNSNDLEIRYKFKVKGEKWGFHRTDILKEFPFPEISGMKFIPENIVWLKIARKYKTRFINEPLRIYCSGTDQITKSGSPKQHSLGLRLYHKYFLNTQLDYLRFSPMTFLHSSLLYSRFSFHLGTSVIEQFKNLETSVGKFLWFTMLPLGCLAYLVDEVCQIKFVTSRR